VSKTLITVALFSLSTFSLSTAFAAIPVPDPGTLPEQPEQSRSATDIGTREAEAFDHLSMGPDPGGKTGDTVTPATTKTGQPSYDGTSASSNQSGPSSTGAREVASDRPVPRTGTTGSKPSNK
jgi:hypothetical protein